MKRLAFFLALLSGSVAFAQESDFNVFPDAQLHLSTGGGTLGGDLVLAPDTVQIRWSNLRLKDVSGILTLRDTTDADSASISARDLFSTAGGTEAWVFRAAGNMEITATGALQWSATTGALNTKDVGLKRGSAGHLTLTDGASGTAGDLTETQLAHVTGVNWNVGTKTTLYTVRSGKSAIITKVVYSGASASATTASCGVGFDAGGINVISSATHAALTTSALASQEFPKAGMAIGASTNILGQVCTVVQGGALTVTADVFGYEF